MFAWSKQLFPKEISKVYTLFTQPKLWTKTILLEGEVARVPGFLSLLSVDFDSGYLACCGLIPCQALC